MIEHLVERSVRAGEVPTRRTVQVGRSQGTVRLLTGWESVGNRAGHELTLQVEQWLGEAFLLDRAGFPRQIAGLAVIADLASLRVISGEGARKPFIGAARRSILDQALRTLQAAQHPQVTFYADPRHVPIASQPTTFVGALTIAGNTRPFALTLTTAPSADGLLVRGSGQLNHSEFGLTPYLGLFGSLRVCDRVEIVIDLVIPELRTAG